MAPWYALMSIHGSHEPGSNSHFKTVFIFSGHSTRGFHTGFVGSPSLSALGVKL